MHGVIVLVSYLICPYPLLLEVVVTIVTINLHTFHYNLIAYKSINPVITRRSFNGPVLLFLSGLYVLFTMIMSYLVQCIGYGIRNEDITLNYILL